MIEVVLSPMQYAVKAFDPAQGQSLAGRTRYAASMLLTDLSMGECRLHFVQGVLTNEINEQVIERCRELGYRRIQFEVPHGTNATRHAEFVETFDGLDRYVIRLEPQREELAKAWGS